MPLAIVASNIYLSTSRLVVHKCGCRSCRFWRWRWLLGDCSGCGSTCGGAGPGSAKARVTDLGSWVFRFWAWPISCTGFAFFGVWVSAIWRFWACHNRCFGFDSFGVGLTKLVFSWLASCQFRIGSRIVL